MAQNRTVIDTLQELKKDYKMALIKSVEQATNDACRDVYKFSMSVLEKYYENYIPSRYDRTDSLWRAAIPIAKVEDMGNMIIGTFGVEYDADILESFAASSYYEASKKYGNVDGDWVVENFLMGIHPATNGGRTTDTAIYTPWQDMISPDEYLKKYLQLRKTKLANDVNDYLLRYITR